VTAPWDCDNRFERRQAMNAKMHRTGIRAMVVLLVAATIGIGAGLHAQTPGQKTFASSKEAIDAFVRAASTDNSADLETILGEGSSAIISSGDPVADKTLRERFVTQYNEKHSLAASGGSTYTLYVGSTDFPLPIPLVKNAGKWYFDGAAGKEEILYRRI